jgi:flavin-binding protein dodecin
LVRSGSGSRAASRKGKGIGMDGSVYKIIELVGTSTESWEQAARNAVETAAESLRDLRIAEVVEMDMQVEAGEITAYRTKVKLSFKYRGEED